MAIDFNHFDQAIHGPVRLGLIAALHSSGPLSFSTLKRLLRSADGALGRHLLVLEEAGYVRVTKRFSGRRPQTVYQITAGGKRALLGYVKMMRELFDMIESDGRPSKGSRK